MGLIINGPSLTLSFERVWNEGGIRIVTGRGSGVSETLEGKRGFDCDYDVTRPFPNCGWRCERAAGKIYSGDPQRPLTASFVTTLMITTSIGKCCTLISFGFWRMLCLCRKNIMINRTVNTESKKTLLLFIITEKLFNINVNKTWRCVSWF